MRSALKQQLEQLMAGTPSESDRKKILASFHQPENEYLVKEELYKQLEELQHVVDDQSIVNEEFDRIWERIGQERSKSLPKTVKWRAVLYWSAAALVIGLIFGTLIPVNYFNEPEKTYYTAVAPKGSVSETILPDSSIIILNAGSRLRYAAEPGGKVREVYLEGEAWFEVEHSEKVPFIVHTGFYDIRVMGTRFNVKSYKNDNEVTTTLEQGSIQAESSDNLKLADDIELHPGEQLTYSKQDKTISVHAVNTKMYSSWKENRLIFVNMSLKELIVLLERKYGVSIKVSDTDILNYHYDGTIKNETIIEVLNILQETLPVYYEINDQEISILKK
ncbi:MAG: FecR domain-containing protein [Prolixibacteraceae bacterium]